MANALLLVVDVQQSLLDGGPDQKDSFLRTVCNLLGAFRENGAPAAFVRHDDGPGSRGLAFGSPGWEIAGELVPLPGERIFDKRFNSAFQETGLEEYLREQGVDTLVITGMQTEYCIDATIKSAFERGFHVLVPVNGTTTFSNGLFSAAQINRFYTENIWSGRFADILPAEVIERSLFSL